MIKTRKTAIRHLYNRKTDVEFRSAKYDLFRNDKEVALIAVSTSKGFFSDLNNVSEELQDDVDVVIAAVENNQKAVFEASVRIKRCIVYSGNPALMDLSQDEVLPVLYAIKEVEAMGLEIPEEQNIFKFLETVRLTEDLSKNLSNKFPTKSSKLKL